MFFIERHYAMAMLTLAETILLLVISRVMVSSQTRYCNKNNIKVCDYTHVNLCCISIIFGYFIGKIILKYYNR